MVGLSARPCGCQVAAQTIRHVHTLDLVLLVSGPMAGVGLPLSRLLVESMACELLGGLLEMHLVVRVLVIKACKLAQIG